MTTTPASIYQHFHLTAHSLKIAIHVWSFANRWLLCPSFLFYTRSHEYEKFLIILDSVKSETDTISSTVHHMISVAVLGFLQGVIYDTGILFYNWDINDYTKMFSNGCTNTFSAHIDNSEFRDFNIKKLTIKSNTSFRSYVCSR